MTIKTAGDLRGFLADVLIGIRDGSIDVEEANSMAKVAAQINQSLAVEVNTALQLQRMGKDQPIAGTMLLRNGETPQPITELAVEDGGGTWCEQCDKRVSDEQARNCTDKFCKVRRASK